MVQAARECWRTRIAGPKGEGTVIHTFEVDLSNQQTRKVFSDALTLKTGGVE